MRPGPPLIAALDQEEIEDARQQTFAQKFLAGADLFDYAQQIALAGIRMQHPEFSPEQVQAELTRRLAIEDEAQ